jgi:hypothetical protein
MSRHEAFLKAIRVEPNDPFHDRIYADFLLDEGYSPPEPYIRIARFLASHLHSSKRTLVLSHNDDIGLFGVEVLTSCSRLDALREIHLPGAWMGNRVVVNIGEAGVVRLVGSLLMRQITTLDVRFNRLGEAAVEALTASPWLGNLERLFVNEPDGSLTGEDWRRLEDHFGDRLRESL